MDFLNEALDNLWVVEYSPTHNIFNIDTLASMLKRNYRQVIEKENYNNYLLFGIFKTGEEANVACDVMQRKQKERRKKMNLLNTVIGDYWVAEYSPEQDAFNVETLAGILAINSKMIAKGNNNGYVPFGVYKTIDEASGACEKMRAIQQKSKRLPPDQYDSKLAEFLPDLLRDVRERMKSNKEPSLAKTA